MNKSQAKKVLKSIVNDNCYYLFKDTIVVEEKSGNDKNIFLPKESKIICFDDMYYAKDGLRIIIATRDCYDLAYILNEYTLMADEIKLTK